MNWASRLTGRLSFSISMVPRSAAFVNGGGKVPAAPLQPPPRTCAIFSMSTSEASCHGRELSRAVTRRELTAEALRRPGKALRCFPSFFPGCRPVRARARSKLFEKSFIKNFYAASRVSSPKNCLYQIKKVYTVHTRRLLSALPFLWSSKSFTSFSVWKNFWAFSPKNSSLTML